MQFPIDKQYCLVLLLVIAAVVIAVVTRKEECECHFSTKDFSLTGSVFLSFGSEYGCVIVCSSFG